MACCPKCGWKIPILSDIRGKRRDFECPDCKEKLRYINTNENLSPIFISITSILTIGIIYFDKPTIFAALLAISISAFFITILLGEKIVIRK